MRNLIVLMTVLLVPVACTATSLEDAALMTACPGLSSWAATHPHEGNGLEDSRDAEPHGSEAKLGRDLARRVVLDQRARAPLSGSDAPTPAQLRQLAAIDSDNLAWLRTWIDRRGFPTVAEVGRQGVLDAWLLVQHAQSAPDFQQAVLDTLMSRKDSTGLSRSDIATLYDRVQLNQGRPQRYGTQFVRDKEGKFLLEQPVEDREAIDSRRAQMDLMPLEVYRCMLHASYDKPSDESAAQ